ncbi:potassium-transporting ATPase KdpC subunit [Marmoricola endophyticus]|uniref:Potassium-transporting ATPase KdpC subunit n=1 Tax=Marmoricola endophyticus TaxID=2040280 RepID=A0A917BHW4_9ACTN|nr:potassium-transporting ATPase subunit KdpC [Marmoricola endophyticus]GGF46378.1 potassium-transporting ATPase KdpC subunit [Marmoricola endophyticus]
MTELFALLRHSLAGLRVLLAATVVCGIAYPLAVTGIAQGVLPWRAEGSLVTAAGAHTTDPGAAVGSVLLGQRSSDAGFFVPRPSAAGDDGYDPLSTSGSNLGPESSELVADIRARRAEVAEREGVRPDQVPADAVTASASGLDPDISPAYAALQVPRVARAAGLPTAQVAALVTEHTDGRSLGVLGSGHVNVLLLNLAVREAAGG